MAEMIKRKIAYIDTTGNVSYERLKEIAAAAQTQINRDVAPHWGYEATVNAYRYVEDIPSDFWPVSIVNAIPERTGINGTHSFTGTGDTRKPYGKVIYQNWTNFDFTESRFTKVMLEETIEMGNNPFLENRIQGQDPQYADKTVTFLVELGDPTNRLDIGYYINDVFVPNFIYPSYFNAIHVEGTKYDHLGLITRPYSIEDGGYQIFQRAQQWYNALKIKGKLYFVKQGDALPETANQDNPLIYWVIGILYAIIILIVLFKNFFQKNKR